MHRWSNRSSIRVMAVVALTLATYLPVFSGEAAAVGFTETFIRLNRMKASTATGGTICVKPSSATTGATEAKVEVTFPSDYTVNSTAANWPVTTSNLPIDPADSFPGPGTAATAWPGVSTQASTVSGQIVTFSSTDLTAATLYCFNFTGGLTTGAAGVNKQALVETKTSGGTVIESTPVALATVTDDQIVITAVVPPSFSFSLSGYTDAFTTNLDISNPVATTGITATVTTNAKGGWIAWAKDQYAGLHSAAANYTINSGGTGGNSTTPYNLPASAEGYLLDIDSVTDATGGCTLHPDPGYDGQHANGSAIPDSGGLLATTFQQVAFCTGPAPATAAGDQFKIIERASIAAATPAATDYTDTITVVGAGNF